jgi:phage I-like protein
MMKRRHALLNWLAVVCGMAVLIGLAAQASEKPTEEYVKAMKTLQTVAAGLPKSLEAEDYAAMEQLVFAARPALSLLETYWTERKVEDAVAAAQKASKAIAEISVTVHLLSAGPNLLAIEGAQDAIKTFTSTCSACHTAHREKLPDGSFLIK